MKKISSNNPPLSFDPDENKRMENELLQLKLKAELGVEAHISSNTPPSIENIFLKNMLAFEAGLAAAEEVRIFELIGKPDFIPEAKLDDISIELALNNLMDLINGKQIALDFLGNYDLRLKYKFITEELFEEKVMNVQLPGMIMHFIYEEFHPNHKLDIEHKAAKFITSWFSQDQEQLSFSLADLLVLPDRRVWKKDKVMNRFTKVFDSYPQFKNGKYTIEDINFEIREEIGLAYAEGQMHYTAFTENHDSIQFEGPFKLYFTLEYEWWSIYYFVIPGFEFASV
ncbi:MAG: hypothetical protein Q8S11_06180 [Daejeonella sp.]|uniref:hypothetical protein n=1 Tax=Daejeonella sp. TaxID=2805397 RepID=UPI0027331652|nr:hypothetical protein [Daejeonella sp.]MDP3467903.1 hypothetical protein [Daejeonella sp.]